MRSNRRSTGNDGEDTPFWWSLEPRFSAASLPISMGVKAASGMLTRLGQLGDSGQAKDLVGFWLTSLVDNDKGRKHVLGVLPDAMMLLCSVSPVHALHLTASPDATSPEIHLLADEQAQELAGRFGITRN